jgi:hypothetical protein
MKSKAILGEIINAKSNKEDALLLTNGPSHITLI